MSQFAGIFFILFSWLLLKYALIYGLSFFYFWKFKPEWIHKYKIQNPERAKPQIQLELKYSFLSMIIMSFVLALLLYFSDLGLQSSSLKQVNYFQIFHQFGSKGLAIELFSILFYVFFYDAYFYWTHRWMHTGWLYKNVHVIHHRSLNPTPFAAYSFHPVEAFINILYLVPFLLFFPVSLPTFFGLLLFSDFSNWNGHVGFDFAPKWSIKIFKNWGGLTTPTHHNMHHQFSKSNFGLYWNGWDRFFNTLHPQTETEFLKVKTKSEAAKNS